jgi:hypothetical protein
VSNLQGFTAAKSFQAANVFLNHPAEHHRLAA